MLASEDAGHGPVNEYPDGFDADALPEHVVRLDDREYAFDPNG